MSHFWGALQNSASPLLKECETEKDQIPAQDLAEDLKKRSAWSIFMGVLTAALGVFLIIYPLATATITTVRIIGDESLA